MSSFVIKTYFDLFNIVFESFPRFYTVCIKCTKAEVLNLLKLGESWRCRNGPDRLQPIGWVWVTTEVFFVVIELSSSVSRHGSLCRDMVHGCRRLLGRDRGFPSRNRVVFLSRQRPPRCCNNVLFFVVTMSRQRFPCRYRDDRGKRSELRQELG